MQDRPPLWRREQRAQEQLGGVVGCSEADLPWRPFGRRSALPCPPEAILPPRRVLPGNFFPDPLQLPLAARAPFLPVPAGRLRIFANGRAEFLIGGALMSPILADAEGDCRPGAICRSITWVVGGAL